MNGVGGAALPDRLPKPLTLGERERPPKEGERRLEKKRASSYNNSEKLGMAWELTGHGGGTHCESSQVG